MLHGYPPSRFHAMKSQPAIVQVGIPSKVLVLEALPKEWRTHNDQCRWLALAEIPNLALPLPEVGDRDSAL